MRLAGENRSSMQVGSRKQASSESQEAPVRRQTFRRGFCSEQAKRRAMVSIAVFVFAAAMALPKLHTSAVRARIIPHRPHLTYNLEIRGTHSYQVSRS